MGQYFQPPPAVPPTNFLKPLFKNIYLFIWPHWVSAVARGIFHLCCSMAIFFVVRSRFPTRDRTRAPCTGNVESSPLDHKGSPTTHSFKHEYSHHLPSTLESVFCAFPPDKNMIFQIVLTFIHLPSRNVDTLCLVSLTWRKVSKWLDPA